MLFSMENRVTKHIRLCYLIKLLSVELVTVDKAVCEGV